jgi:hypothetical protein
MSPNPWADRLNTGQRSRRRLKALAAAFDRQNEPFGETLGIEQSRLGVWTVGRRR